MKIREALRIVKESYRGKIIFGGESSNAISWAAQRGLCGDRYNFLRK